MDPHNKYLLPAAMFLLGMFMFTGVVLWYGMQGSYRSTADLLAVGPEEEEGVPPPESTPYMDASLELFGGNVVAVDGNSVVIQHEDGAGNVTVFTDNRTEIYGEGALKDSDEYQQEVDAFDEMIRLGDPARVYLTPPPFEKDQMQLSDLEIGAYVFIYPRSQETGGIVAEVIYYPELQSQR